MHIAFIQDASIDKTRRSASSFYALENSFKPLWMSIVKTLRGSSEGWRQKGWMPYKSKESWKANRSFKCERE